MTDTIFITGIVIHARHGVMEHETEVGQRFVIDLELYTDLSESSRTDRLSDTVSYSNVVATATSAFKNTITSCSSAPPVRWPRTSWRPSRASGRSRSRCTSRTRRSPRSSTMSAWC